MKHICEIFNNQHSLNQSANNQHSIVTSADNQHSLLTSANNCYHSRVLSANRQRLYTSIHMYVYMYTMSVLYTIYMCVYKYTCIVYMYTVGLYTSILVYFCVFSQIFCVFFVYYHKIPHHIKTRVLLKYTKNEPFIAVFLCSIHKKFCETFNNIVLIIGIISSFQAF